MKSNIEIRKAQENKEENKSKEQKSDYVRVKKIGEGSYATVFLEKKSEKTRVSKVFNDDADNMKDGDVETEINLLSQFNHPNIIKYLGHSFEIEKVLYLEYAAQGSLHSFIEDNTLMDWDSFGIRCAYQISCAISYLHGNKIVHRDVKPENILLMADYTAKLCDFGYSGKLSKINRRAFIGSSLFMAPEIIQGEKYDYKVDCYAFGITLFEMSAMDDAWPDKSKSEIYTAVENGEVQPLADKTPKIIKDIYYECTLFSPRRRPAAKTISNQLANYLEEVESEETKYSKRSPY